MKKYEPLQNYLGSAGACQMTFEEIESVLGTALPATARNRGQWWANEASQDSRHVQCKAWLAAGLKVVGIDLIRETVQFA